MDHATDAATDAPPMTSSFMTPDEAFLAGLALVRADGIDARGHDVAVLAAHRVFLGRAEPKQFDPRFPVDGPRYARILILDAYAMGGGE